ncbi:hypothetical protein OpiT1DRAFT_05682 [Opitutaceae bacterium TAV1]|nr:hypothetical protein OpiT1DRAFT_05682 [Opitutaceae bacterium TAV1]
MSVTKKKTKRTPHTKARFFTTPDPRKSDRTKIPRSINWDADVLNLIEAHRAKLGLDRSAYVQACAEHILDIREHPELFHAANRLTKAEIAKLTGV